MAAWIEGDVRAVMTSVRLVPLCPHCKAELQKLHVRQVSSVFGKRYIYFCPSCRCALGVSHRKGFWMG